MMTTHTDPLGYWNQVKGQIRDRWGQLSDRDLQRARGSAEELIGVIQQKTGESRGEIERFIQAKLEEAEGLVSQARDMGRQYAETFGEAARQGYAQVGSKLESGYDETRKLVKAHPVESLLTAVGIGAIAGVALCLVLRSNRS